MTSATATDLMETFSADGRKANEAVTQARAALATAVTNGAGVDSLAEKLGTVAEAEGFAAMAALAHKVASHVVNVEGVTDYDVASARVLRAVLRQLATGAGDDYSGRRNDVARSRFDGQRRFADRLAY